MKNLTTIPEVNKVFADKGEIDKSQWLEIAARHFKDTYAKECRLLINTFTGAAMRKDRRSYASAASSYRDWISQIKTSIIGMMKRDSANFMKYYGLEPTLRLGKSRKPEFAECYAPVVKQVLRCDGLAEDVIDTYNRLIVPMANLWLSSSYEERKKLCGEI